jgi:CMP-N,N'-diacetyllegionaminic acid synthase
MSMKNIVAIIPARGGSKGVKKKNIKPLAGKPLLAWTIEEALKVPDISAVFVSTEDASIAEVARAYGAQVLERPPELANDKALDFPYFHHHLSQWEKEGKLPDMIVDLRATAPLRRANRIKEGIDLLLSLGKEGADSVRAVASAAKHPYKMWKFDGQFIRPFLDESFTGMKEPFNANRQDLPPVFQNNGCMNAFWPETILRKHSVTGERIAGYAMEDWESVNIDTELDFLLAEALMAEHPLAS